MPVTSPSAADSRIHSLDVLRGLALFGMILVHFHQKMRLEVGGLEDLIGWGVYILVEQKAWGTFAFLFGVGFAVLLRRLEARGAPVVTTYLRRLAGLAAFGVIAQVGFGFTILFTYAAWGVALLFVRRWSTRALLLLALTSAMARPVAAEIAALWVWWTGASPASSGWALTQAAERAAEHGSYADLLIARWRLFIGTTPGGWSGLLPDVNLSLFVIGLLAVRHHVLEDPLRHKRLIVSWMACGALSWLAFWTVLRPVEAMSFPGAGWPLAMGLGVVRDQWLCFAYIGAVVLALARHPRWGEWLMPFALAGRMALTNYMVQIVVLDVMASGYGFGLELRPAVYLAAAALLFAVEAFLSRLWLARHSQGPLERLWRAVTYGRLDGVPQYRMSRRPTL